MFSHVLLNYSLSLTHLLLSLCTARTKGSCGSQDWWCSTLWNQEMECRCHVVVGYLRWYGESMVERLNEVSLYNMALHYCSLLTLYLMTISAQFVEIHSTNLRLNIKPIRRLRTTMVFPLPLVIVDTSFIWIAFSDGWKRDRSVHFATRSGTLPKSSVFLAMDNWGFKFSSEGLTFV